MLYNRNLELGLDDDLFRNPGAEYRGAPFWAWNCSLEKEELLRQIGVLHEMGMGGFHIHSRVGMSTPYLGEEFMDLVSACNQKAKKTGMLCWLYDEDKWPSGFAGGYVTRDVRFRARHLLFTKRRLGEAYCRNRVDFEAAVAAGKKPAGYFLAGYAVFLRGGFLDRHLRLDKGATVPDGAALWYAYLELENESPWFNGQTYVDTLSDAAIRRFIEVTHLQYARRFQNDFGGSIPAIFTDEPQFAHKESFRTPEDSSDIRLPFSDDFPEKFAAAYGTDLLTALPELLWQLPGNRPSAARYHYHDFVCERFVGAFCDQIGVFCASRGLMLTGHVMDEDSLASQTKSVGEAMRCYRGFGLPGVDVLVDGRLYSTVKQAQSVSHQYGRPGVLSEIYGVTGYRFDFRGYKLAGDWQAALGVTTRVHHLSLVSMKGEAKRDYPVSINYQMPWWREYRYIEDHFARVNTAMTRGQPVVRVGVIHPIESYWLSWGPMLQTEGVREELEENFRNIVRWLLFAHIDFDFISESLLPALSPEEQTGVFVVGKMAYDVVIVPGCRTVRSTTLSRLEKFIARGGKVIQMGDAPQMADAEPSGLPARILTEHIPFSKTALLDALQPYREVSILNEEGRTAPNLLCQLRRDGGDRWLFIAHAEPTPDYGFAAQLRNAEPDPAEKIRIVVRGEWHPILYDTMTGSVGKLTAVWENGSTVIERTFFPCDSLLIRLCRQKRETLPFAEEAPSVRGCEPQYLAESDSFTLSEPNVLLLDTAEYSSDGVHWEGPEELLKIDGIFAGRLGIADKGNVPQPWVRQESGPEKTVWLRFRIRSETELPQASLALENAETTRIFLNGERIVSRVSGWFIDKAILRVDGLKIRQGENELVLACRYAKNVYLEWCYLLGTFGVRVCGREAFLIQQPGRIRFGDCTVQGLPFFGGNLTYHCGLTSHGGRLLLEVPRYGGALVSAELDGSRAGRIAFPPYLLDLGTVPAGRHRLDLTVYGGRGNTLGAVHNCFENMQWYGPYAWRSKGSGWSYQYQLTKMGILTTPRLYEK